MKSTVVFERGIGHRPETHGHLTQFFHYVWGCTLRQVRHPCRQGNESLHTAATVPVGIPLGTSARLGIPHTGHTRLCN
jgi:hypothetical protein